MDTVHSFKNPIVSIAESYKACIGTMFRETLCVADNHHRVCHPLQREEAVRLLLLSSPATLVDRVSRVLPVNCSTFYNPAVRDDTGPATWARGGAMLLRHYVDNRYIHAKDRAECTRHVKNVLYREIRGGKTDTVWPPPYPRLASLFQQVEAKNGDWQPDELKSTQTERDRFWAGLDEAHGWWFCHPQRLALTDAARALHDACM